MNTSDRSRHSIASVKPADDFASEVELLQRSHDFRTFLDERFRCAKRRSLDDVERRLVRATKRTG